MAASYQAEDVLVLGQQLRVQEICLFANSTLLSVVGGDLKLQFNEPINSVLMVIKQVSAGSISGIAATLGGDGTSIVITGESAAAATTSYLIKYIATFP
jgi:hypothetical protein